MTYNLLRKGRVGQVGGVYHITTVTRGRIACFESLENGRKVVRELMALQHTGRAETLCFMLMPDHLHWLMQLHKWGIQLNAVMVKLCNGIRYTASAIKIAPSRGRLPSQLRRIYGVVSR